MQGENEYYAAASGIPGSVDDNRRAFWAKKSGLAGGSTNDHMMAAMIVDTGDSTHDIGYQSLLWFRSNSGIAAGSVADHMQAFFLSHPDGSDPYASTGDSLFPSESLFPSDSLYPSNA